MLFHRANDKIPASFADVNDISSVTDFIVEGDGPILHDAMISPNNQSETLQDYLRREAESQGINHDDIAERAQQAGHKLSAGYVNNMMNGYANNPSPKKILGLAAGLGKDPEDVFSVVRGEKPTEDKDFSTSFFYTLWRDFSSLPDDQQPLFMHHFQVIHQGMTKSVKTIRKGRSGGVVPRE